MVNEEPLCCTEPLPVQGPYGGGEAGRGASQNEFGALQRLDGKGVSQEGLAFALEEYEVSVHDLPSVVVGWGFSFHLKVAALAYPKCALMVFPGTRKGGEVDGTDQDEVLCRIGFQLQGQTVPFVDASQQGCLCTVITLQVEGQRPTVVGKQTQSVHAAAFKAVAIDGVGVTFDGDVVRA